MLRSSVDGSPSGGPMIAFLGKLLDVVGGDVGVHGGMKIYRGAAAAARNYVEADRVACR